MFSLNPPDVGAPQEVLDAWASSDLQEPVLSKVILSLLLVLTLILAFTWLLKRFSRFGGRGTAKGGMKVMETLPLGGRRMVQVVRVHDRNLVIGVTSERIDLLTELNDEEEETFGNILPLHEKKTVEAKGKVSEG